MTRFFVSYTAADRAWAEWIAWHLDRNGYEVVLQAWDMRPGSNFIEEMDRAATTSDHTIAVLSPDYVASPFAQSEWEAAFRADPTGTQRRLIPVQVRKVDRTGLLGSIVAVDLTGLDEPAAVKALLRGLEPGRTPPAVAPAYPGGSAIAYPGEAHDREHAPILLDQAHGQAGWSVPLTATQGYRRAAAIAAGLGHPLRPWTDAPLPSAAILEDFAAVVVATAPHGRCHLSSGEVDALQRYVGAGGGLLLVSTYTGDWHHESNLNDVLAPFGLVFNRDVVMPGAASPEDCRRQVLDFRPDSAFVVPATPASPIATSLAPDVDVVLTLSSCSIAVSGDGDVLVQSDAAGKTCEPLPLGVTSSIDRYEDRRAGPAGVVAAARAGSGRVVAAGSLKMFLDQFMDAPGYDNASLFRHLLRWLVTRG